jgi:hypothetical protein
MLSVQLL